MLRGGEELATDFLSPYWTSGQETVVNVTVVNPLQAVLAAQASEEGCLLWEEFEKSANEGINFTTMAVDTFVGWHPVLALIPCLPDSSRQVQLVEEKQQQPGGEQRPLAERRGGGEREQHTGCFTPAATGSFNAANF